MWTLGGICDSIRQIDMNTEMRKYNCEEGIGGGKIQFCEREN